MSKKGNMPSVRDLRDALGREKKQITGNETLHVRVRVYSDRWLVDSGFGQFLVDEDPAVLAVEHAVMERASSSQRMAAELVPRLKANLGEHARTSIAVGDAITVNDHVAFERVTESAPEDARRDALP